MSRPSLTTGCSPASARKPRLLRPILVNLALGAIGVAYDLYPALDALPVEQPRCLLHLIGEKVERLGRDRPACRLKGKRPGDFGTTT